MRKLFTLGVLFFVLAFFAGNTATAKPSPVQFVLLKKQDPKPNKNIPQKVLSAYENLLPEIEDQLGFSLSTIDQIAVKWTKYQGQYQVMVSFNTGSCDEGGTGYVIIARFKANGDIVKQMDADTEKKFLISEGECIRIGF